MKRLFLYFSVVFFIVIAATSFNRFVLDKKQSVEQVFEKTASLIDVEKGAPTSPVVTADVSNNEDIKEVGAPFVNWLQSEANLVNSTSVDQKEKEKELQQRAQNLDGKQVAYLKKKSLAGGTPQTQRILSIYMLTLGGEAAQKALIDVASQTEIDGPAEPHSVKEITDNQARSVAFMAIDAIAESSKSVSLRIDELQQIIGRASDSSVKNYAQRKQDELKSL